MEFLLLSPLSPIPTAQIVAQHTNPSASVPTSAVSPKTKSLPSGFENANTYSTVDPMNTINHHFRPLIEDGAGLRILNDLVESIGAMEGGDFDSWLSLVTTHFEDLSRFQLVLTGGEQLQMFDIPTHYLPRFFLSLPSIPSITLVDPVESPADEAGCLILCPDLEWQWRNDRFQNHELAYGKDERQIEYSNEDGSESKQQTAEDRGNDLSAIWKGALSVNVGATRKIERLEIILQVDDGKGGVKVFPESAIRSLKVCPSFRPSATIGVIRLQLSPNERIRQHGASSMLMCELGFDRLRKGWNLLH
nr:hypothetical protein L204_04617 [Cryptococcus depauperatus CBS 7855]